MPDAGVLRHRVALQRLNRLRDDEGGVSYEPETVEMAWARIEPLQGREFWQAQQVASDITHRVTIRSRSWLTSDHQLAHAGRTLNITSIADKDDRGIYSTLMCMESTSGGG